MWSKHILLHYLYHLVVLKLVNLISREMLKYIKMSEQQFVGQNSELRDTGLLLRCCTTVGPPVRSMEAAINGFSWENKIIRMNLILISKA